MIFHATDLSPSICRIHDESIRQIEREAIVRARQYAKSRENLATSHQLRQQGSERILRLQKSQASLRNAADADFKSHSQYNVKLDQERLRRIRSNEEIARRIVQQSRRDTPSPQPLPAINNFAAWPLMLLTRLSQPTPSNISFTHIPWPIFKTFTVPHEISSNDITLLNVRRFLEESKRRLSHRDLQRLIKLLLLRFHPDKIILLIPQMSWKSSMEKEDFRQSCDTVLQVVYDFKNHYTC